jgi:hypothetical protein
MFWPQYVGHLEVVREELIKKIHKHRWGGDIEGLLGKVRDLASERGKSARTGDYDFRHFRQYILELIHVCFGTMVLYCTHFSYTSMCGLLCSYTTYIQLCFDNTHILHTYFLVI